ncbi:stage II sporulation protein R [Roseburia hominis]
MQYREVYLPDEVDQIRRRDRVFPGKKSVICLVAAVLMAGVLTGSVVHGQRVSERVKKTQEDLAGEVFRFHVLANSDSEEDQALKMRVKEAVISYMEEELPEAESAEETKEWARAHVEDIEEVAGDVIHEEGYGYAVKAKVTECEFPDKTYGDVTFPAGRYEALRIEIGEGEGHNWWCVLYPNLCFLDCVHAIVPEEGKEELKEVLTDEEYEMVTAGTKFRIKCFFLGE